MSRLQTPIRRNDTVLVTAGKDRGKRGRVLKVLPEKNRLRRRGRELHQAATRGPNPSKNIKGGIMKREAPLHASQRAAGLPRVRGADAHRPPDARRRAQGPDLPQVRGSGRQMSRVKERYLEDVVPALMKEFGYTNVMAVPKITKMSLNMGLGEATQNAKIVDGRQDELRQIAGQKAVITRARKSIAQFKLREGMPIGAMVTLRGDRMYEFLDRLIIDRAAPRARLPRRLAEGLRRPRQLHARPEGPADVPGDRLHEGRQGAGHEHVGLHDRQDRRRRPGAAAADRACRSGQS